MLLQPQFDPQQYMPTGGLFLVDKPLGWTSFDVVNKIRFALGRRLGMKRPKVGHAGTLDPLATGLLVICVGGHTKLISDLQAEEKCYTGHFVLGATTASYDRETPPEHWQSTEHITPDLLEHTRKQFLGSLQQLPPMFSAVKVEGKKLYEVARTGKSMELQPRTVEIYDFQIGEPEQITPNHTVTSLLKPTVRYYAEERGIRIPFEVRCSKGTYIRSLAHDFGLALGCGGYLGSLRRTGSGAFSVEDAWSVESWVHGLAKES